jgi:hypothetical protein
MILPHLVLVVLLHLVLMILPHLVLVVVVLPPRRVITDSIIGTRYAWHSRRQPR